MAVDVPLHKPIDCAEYLEGPGISEKNWSPELRKEILALREKLKTMTREEKDAALKESMDYFKVVR